MKRKSTNLIIVLGMVITVLFLVQCSSNKTNGDKKTGCKGIYLINQTTNYSDSTITKLKKGIGLIDALIGKSLLDISNANVDSTDVFERYVNKVREIENKTPEKVVTDYNARMNDFCYRTKELLKLSKDKRNYSELQRQRFLDEYFVLLKDYRMFLDILDGRIDDDVDEILKKKSMN